MSVLVIAEHDHGSLKGATLNTVTAALACGGEVHVLVAGHNAGAAAAAAAQVAGVAKVLHADGAQFAHGLAENVAAQVLALASGYSHILFPATASGKNAAPRVAAKLDVAQISDITRVDSPDTFERPIYAGNAMATVQATDAVKVCAIRAPLHTTLLLLSLVIRESNSRVTVVTVVTVFQPRTREASTCGGVRNRHNHHNCHWPPPPPRRPRSAGAAPHATPYRRSP
jgi:electron transfer flavoprotein alpha subunit